MWRKDDGLVASGRMGSTRETRPVLTASLPEVINLGGFPTSEKESI